jgi:hypothetical protein
LFKKSRIIKFFVEYSSGGDATTSRLFVVQIEALMKQAQYQYLLAFASTIRPSLTKPIHRMAAAEACVFSNRKNNKRVSE